MTHPMRLVRLGLTSLALAATGLVVGAYAGGADGAPDHPPANTSLPAANCTVPPPGVSVADWCPAN